MSTVTDTSTNPQRAMIEAIALKRLILANYNGAEMLLAPHQLFSRHDELYVSAFNPRKNWRSEEERRLGHFKLDGLSNLRLTDETFEPLPDFDATPPRETDEQVFTVSA